MEFLSRLGCRLILLPLGAELNESFTEPIGGIVYGKLLYGGVSRFHLLPSSITSDTSKPLRRAAQQTVISNHNTNNHHDDHQAPSSWIEYGGPQRKYQAIDMGPAALLEVTLLPYGKEMPSISHNTNKDMAMSQIYWNPQKIFTFLHSNNHHASSSSSSRRPSIKQKFQSKCQWRHDSSKIINGGY